MKNDEKSKFQELVYKVFPNCWICGNQSETVHHCPPKVMNPKLYIKIPVCKKCHKLINNEEYTGKEKRSLRANIRKIEKSVKNIRVKLLDKNNRHYQNSLSQCESK